MLRQRCASAECVPGVPASGVKSECIHSRPCRQPVAMRCARGAAGAPRTRTAAAAANGARACAMPSPLRRQRTPLASAAARSRLGAPAPLLLGYARWWLGQRRAGGGLAWALGGAGGSELTPEEEAAYAAFRAKRSERRCVRIPWRLLRPPARGWFANALRAGAPRPSWLHGHGRSAPHLTRPCPPPLYPGRRRAGAAARGAQAAALLRPPQPSRRAAPLGQHA